jgi:predicted dehydrogenase
MNQKIRLGIVGCGVIGRAHLEACRNIHSIEVAGIADLRQTLVESTAQEFGVASFHTDPAELFQRADIDAVVLAVPTSGRALLAIEALKNGKHVLIEKPAAMNVEELKHMREFQGNRVIAFCSSRFRFMKHAQVASKYVTTGKLGELRIIRCRAITPAGLPPEQTPLAWRYRIDMNGGGIWYNWGVYDLDYLLGIAGWQCKPIEAFAQIWGTDPDRIVYTGPSADGETHGIGLIRCANGMMISFERGEYVADNKEGIWQIIGSHGSLTLKMTDMNNSLVAHEFIPGIGTTSSVIWQGEENIGLLTQRVLQDFSSSIIDRKEPMTGMEQAIIAQGALDMMISSAKNTQSTLGGNV